MKNSRDKGVEFVCKCGNCSAVTVTLLSGVTNSMRPKHVKEHYGHLKIDQYVYGCDYCVNNWGIDLCGCGSGQKVGRCDNGYNDCKNGIPAQRLGKKKEFIGRDF